MTLLLTLFIISAVLLIAIGFYSIIATKNLMRILMAIEILAKAATLVMIGAGYQTGKMGVAQSFVITIIIIEVMLLVIATGILFGVYNNSDSLETRHINNLKG